MNGQIRLSKGLLGRNACYRVFYGRIGYNFNGKYKERFNALYTMLFSFYLIAIGLTGDPTAPGM